MDTHPSLYREQQNEHTTKVPKTTDLPAVPAPKEDESSHADWYPTVFYCTFASSMDDIANMILCEP